MRRLRRAAGSLARLSAATGRTLLAAWSFLAALPGRVARLLRRMLARMRAVMAAVAAGLARVAQRAVRTMRRMLPVARATALVATAAGVLAIVLGTTAFAASRLNADYGAGQEQLNALAWAGRTQSYAGATCAACHATEQAEQSVTHSTVSCEGCHGPLVEHPATDGGTASRLVVPDSEACITCHSAAEGHPVSFPQVDPEEHYSANACLRCHDPHAVVAVAPPDVTHPLERLPACTVCHNPDGLKKVPSGHEMVADQVCLSCHGVPGDDD
jgi:hypothetical protein